MAHSWGSHVRCWTPCTTPCLLYSGWAGSQSAWWMTWASGKWVCTPAGSCPSHAATGAWTSTGTTGCAPLPCLDSRLTPHRPLLAGMSPTTPRVQCPVRHCWIIVQLWCCRTWCWWCPRHSAGSGSLFHLQSVRQVRGWVACRTACPRATRWRGRQPPSWPGPRAAPGWSWLGWGSTGPPRVTCSTVRSVCSGFSSWH